MRFFMPSDYDYSAKHEFNQNKILAERINKFWKKNGKNANARVVQDFYCTRSRVYKYSYIVSDIDPRWRSDFDFYQF